MAKGKTKSGFKYSVDKATLNDAEFLEAFCKVRKGDNMEIFNMIETVLGKEQKASLYEHVRDKDGRVPLDVLTNEVSEILAALGENEETKKQ